MLMFSLYIVSLLIVVIQKNDENLLIDCKRQKAKKLLYCVVWYCIVIVIGTNPWFELRCIDSLLQMRYNNKMQGAVTKLK